MTASLGGEPIEAVIFDWGGTLSTFATSVSARELWAAAAAPLAPHCAFPAARIAELLAAVEDEFWDRTADPKPRSGTLAGLVAEAHRRLGGRAPPEALGAACAAYLGAWAPHIEHDAGAVPALRALRAAGVRTAMLSNTHWPRSFHERFLARDGLAGLLGARVYTCELEWMKPHPAAFGAALRAAGVDDPARALYVGDRPRDDIFGARRAGLRTALRPNPLVPAFGVEPDLGIAGLPELPARLGVAAPRGTRRDGRGGCAAGGATPSWASSQRLRSRPEA